MVYNDRLQFYTRIAIFDHKFKGYRASLGYIQAVCITERSSRGSEKSESRLILKLINLQLTPVGALRKGIIPIVSSRYLSMPTVYCSEQ